MKRAMQYDLRIAVALHTIRTDCVHNATDRMDAGYCLDAPATMPAGMMYYSDICEEPVESQVWR